MFTMKRSSEPQAITAMREALSSGKYTVKTLAKAAKVGRSSIEYWKSGKFTPTKKNQNKLLKALTTEPQQMKVTAEKPQTEPEIIVQIVRMVKELSPESKQYLATQIR